MQAPGLRLIPIKHKDSKAQCRYKAVTAPRWEVDKERTYQERKAGAAPGPPCYARLRWSWGAGTAHEPQCSAMLECSAGAGGKGAGAAHEPQRSSAP